MAAAEPVVRTQPTGQAAALMAYVLFLLLHGEAVDYSYCSASAAAMNRLCSYPVFALAMYLLWQTSTMDPGVVTASGEVSANSKHCDICNLDNPIDDKTYHCRACGYCVKGHDHHCGVLGRCVGEKNRGRFVVVLALGVAGHVLAALACACHMHDSLWAHLTYIMRQLKYGDLRTTMTLVWAVVMDHWLLAAYAYIGLALTGFWGFHVFVLLTGTTTRQVLKKSGRPGNANATTCGNKTSAQRAIAWIKDMCGESCAGRIARLHRCLDLNICDAQLTPPQRFYICTIGITGPFVAASVYMLHTYPSGQVYVWAVCTFICAAVSVRDMRRVVFSRLNQSQKDDAGVAEVDDTLIEGNLDSVALSRDGQHYCEICCCSWTGQDHHCGMFGVCIHRGNRADYTRCIHVGTIGAFLYIPPSARLLYANWEISITLHNGIYQFAVSCIEAIYKSAPYLLAFYASVGLAAAGTVFSLQQFAYMSLERDLSSPSDGAGCLPTDVIRLLVEVLFKNGDLSRFERDILRTAHSNSIEKL